MITPIVPFAAYSGASHLSDLRDRSAAGVRTMLPESVASTPRASRADNNNSQPGQGAPQQGAAEPHKDNSSMFAAAVISGALPPTPQSMEELIMRIGSSTIPEESQARLKDLLA
ncbi:hypothetical protein [Devosia sp. FKR38]|uniref:hypothetical protein n=1 Tax=Devosia sp. FKR38 TaxID=2562312 RepID=UPI0010C10B1E|nr:hypothetical protein [Devosia sp. FKR38]